MILEKAKAWWSELSVENQEHYAEKHFPENWIDTTAQIVMIYQAEIKLGNITPTYSKPDLIRFGQEVLEKAAEKGKIKIEHRQDYLDSKTKTGMDGYVCNISSFTSDVVTIDKKSILSINIAEMSEDFCKRE